MTGVFYNWYFPGKFHKTPLLDMHQKIRNEYGSIFYFPGMLGKEGIVMSFDPNDIEKVFRQEGPWPDRRGLEILNYYRKNIRPEIYSEFGGLFAE